MQQKPDSPTLLCAISQSGRTFHTRPSLCGGKAGVVRNTCAHAVTASSFTWTAGETIERPPGTKIRGRVCLGL
eukprot:scaffold650_cov407-Prasinococcus_capsulatus_cf.AAC.28